MSFAGIFLLCGHEEVRLKANDRSQAGLVVVITVFALTRVLAYLVGVRFDASPLGDFWQYLDPPLLRTQLLESLYYLHSQPPVYNLFLGLILKLFPGQEAVAFQVVYLGLGLTLTVAVFRIMIRLGAAVWAAVLTTLVVACSPASILYENLLFYTYPLAVGLVLTALFLHRYLENRRSLDLVGFVACLALLVLTRSMFHLAWLALAACVLALIRPADLRRIAIVGSLAFLLAGGPYIKNTWEFGSFTSSSWGGMSLARLTTWRLDKDERYRLVADLRLDPVSLYNPFRNLATYRQGAGFPLAGPTGIEALDQMLKTGGSPNYNNRSYVDISRRYLSDDLYVIRNYPTVYLGALAEAGYTYFLPTSAHWFVRQNRAHLVWWDRVYNHALYGEPVYWSDLANPPERWNIGIFSLVGYLVVAALVLVRLWHARRHLDQLSASEATLMFAGLTLIYVSLVGNAFELGENNRFRYIVEPLFWIYIVASLSRLRRGRKAGIAQEGNSVAQ